MVASVLSMKLYMQSAVMIKNKNWRTDLKMFVDKYSDDIDSVLELRAELDMWEMFWNKVMS